MCWGSWGFAFAAEPNLASVNQFIEIITVKQDCFLNNCDAID
jgi:hypothetical protein